MAKRIVIEYLSGIRKIIGQMDILPDSVLLPIVDNVRLIDNNGVVEPAAAVGRVVLAGNFDRYVLYKETSEIGIQISDNDDCA